MDIELVKILIPVYQVELSDAAKKSLCQCCVVLSAYPICFVCPKSLDVRNYVAICKSYGISYQLERWDDTYFADIAGYNRLLLSKSFYERFRSSQYILIYQLDAYVFTDKLQSWCDKGYDYIGAPLVGHFSDKSFSDKMRVGNGGFSLRKTRSYLRFFNSKRNVFGFKQIVRNINMLKKPYTRIFVLVFMLLGWRNKPTTVARRWQYNEDDFWSGLLDHSKFALYKPDTMEAMNFAFERFPSKLYQINGNQLPFGCHAWEKYQYEEFWINFI